MGRRRKTREDRAGLARGKNSFLAVETLRPLMKRDRQDFYRLFHQHTAPHLFAVPARPWRQGRQFVGGGQERAVAGIEKRPRKAIDEIGRGGCIADPHRIHRKRGEGGHKAIGILRHGKRAEQAAAGNELARGLSVDRNEIDRAARGKIRNGRVGQPGDEKKSVELIAEQHFLGTRRLLTDEIDILRLQPIGAENFKRHLLARRTPGTDAYTMALQLRNIRDVRAAAGHDMHGLAVNAGNGAQVRERFFTAKGSGAAKRLIENRRTDKGGFEMARTDGTHICNRPGRGFDHSDKALNAAGAGRLAAAGTGRAADDRREPAADGEGRAAGGTCADAEEGHLLDFLVETDRSTHVKSAHEQGQKRRRAAASQPAGGRMAGGGAQSFEKIRRGTCPLFHAHILGKGVAALHLIINHFLRGAVTRSGQGSSTLYGRMTMDTGFLNTMTSRTGIGPLAANDAAHSRRNGLRIAAVMFCSAIALSGCATTGASTSAARPAQAGAASTPAPSETELKEAAVSSTRTEDYVAAAAYWGGLYERKPDDAETAINYSKALRQIGSLAQSLSVMQRAQALHPDDPAVLAECGKVLTASGKPEQAAAMLSRAAQAAPGDWTVLSAEGVALDQMGRYDEAQSSYTAALKLSPGNPSVLTNLGLSYTLQGNLDAAEQTLRKAVSDPRAHANARQNLAVVLALRGNFDEASRLAHADLPANIADNNIAYLREMLTQPALWKQMEQLDAKPQEAAPDQVSSMPPSTATSLR